MQKVSPSGVEIDTGIKKLPEVAVIRGASGFFIREVGRNLGFPVQDLPRDRVQLSPF